MINAKVVHPHAFTVQLVINASKAICVFTALHKLDFAPFAELSKYNI